MLEPAVLVVEDEVIVAMDLATKLRALKYHVIETVSSGEEALRLAEQRRPDLVLLDLKLAGPLDGIQTAQQLKQYDIPIVFVTANSDRETLKKANALEPSGYILKPFGERDLAIQLDIALYKHHANRRLLENGQRLKQANETLALETAALSRLTELSSRLWRKGSLREGLEEMLGATIELLRADMGNVQLLSDGVLSIVAQRGFQQDFLDFFREVSVGDDSACGRALREGERIVIQDVECDPPYAALRELARKAGYRAVQSTPLIGHNGEPLGMLSTHWRSVHHPTVQELRRLDLYVRQAVDFIQRLKTHEALRESEERFRRLVEVSSKMAWTTDADGIPREDSPSWRKFTGFRLDQYLNGSQWLEAIHPEDRQRVDEVWQEACRTRSHYTVETRMRRADGVYRRIFARALPLLNEDGSVRQWVGMNCDVTDLRASEEALCESEERFRTLGDHMTQFAWMIDQSGEAVWFNRRWYEYTGCTPEQMHGWGWRSVHHPDHEERVVASWRRALATGEPWDETFPLRGANGQYRWFLTRAVPVKDAQGSLVRWFGTNTDITELRSVEAALHESQERLNAIVQTAVDGIITIDEKGTIESINPAVERIFHYAEEELIGHNVKMLMPEPDRRRHDDYLQRYRQTGEKKIIGIGREVLGRRKDGLVFPVELSISESRLPGRRFFTGILRDISVRKKAEEQLRLLTIELDQRVASRTQELEQSQDRLRALATELNLAEQRERKRLAAELHDHLQQMLVLGRIKLGQGKRIAASNAAYLKVLQETDDLFSESLKYTRTLVAELSPPALREGGLPAALTWLADSMKKHELNVIVKIPDGKLPALPEDQAVLLFQSTRELLINSSKHAGTHEAWVTVTYGNGTLTIEVKDEGAGFDVAATGVAEIAGGLSSRFGLFSVQERMKALGGSLEIRSVLGAGTRATLTLPFRSNGEFSKP
jgi:PAS domain S-box-containing protein